MRRALSSIHHAARLDQPFLRVLPRALGRLMSLAALIAFALFTTGKSHGEAGAEMLEEYNRLLNIFILIAGILAGFSLVWAAFVLMWGEPENPHARGRAKGAVIGAISGLVLVLLAKGLMVLLVDSTTVLLPTR